jgi:hypothetical protein
VRAIVTSAVVALVVVGAWHLVETRFDRDEAAAPALTLRYTDELVEDGWVDGARTPGTDLKPLENAANSICFLTKIELKGVQGPDDTSSCSIGIDDFTGYWQVSAAVGDGSKSAVRCNARCLIWE